MNLAAKIEEFKAKTKEIRVANPEIAEVGWEIRDIPWEQFDEFRQELNKNKRERGERDIDLYPASDKFMYFPNLPHSFDDGCVISFYSTRVKFNHTAELAKEQILVIP